jgi:hypothetical protein
MPFEANSKKKSLFLTSRISMYSATGKKVHKDSKGHWVTSKGNRVDARKVRATKPHKKSSKKRHSKK